MPIVHALGGDVMISHQQPRIFCIKIRAKSKQQLTGIGSRNFYHALVSANISLHFYEFLYSLRPNILDSNRIVPGRYVVEVHGLSGRSLEAR